jgi:hypothetical protein
MRGDLSTTDDERIVDLTKHKTIIRMISFTRKFAVISFIFFGCISVLNAFVVGRSVPLSLRSSASQKVPSYHIRERQSARPVATVDPATALSNVLGDLVLSPAVLAVPILAAMSVAAVVVGFIIGYSNPEDEDK